MNTGLKSAPEARKINRSRESACIFKHVSTDRINTSARAALCESGRPESRVNIGLAGMADKYRASGCDPHEHWARERLQTRINTGLQAPGGFGSFLMGEGSTVKCALDLRQNLIFENSTTLI